MQPISWSRLRWRMRGAWLWPAFVVASVVGGTLLDRLPVAGEGTGVVAGVLLAGFFNLIALILVGAAGGLVLRRRRPDLPHEVAREYAGTAGVALVCLVLLGAGLAHRPAVRERQRDFSAQSLAARRFLAHRAPPDVRPNVALADSLRLDDDLYRTCAPRREPDRAFCLYVDTSQSPPGISVDSNRAPNRTYLPAVRRR